ncbi:unnamed protein product, partial [Mesorhabditis belari]|uniref:Alpha-2-macroglobulin domain-containing protein n=1 Tax=Mesorhabditis belari TaxID=2138241 RepID=A0AAF3FBH2_9BILA
MRIQDKTITDLYLEVRDQGTGKKGSAQIRHDPLSTGFQIVPLKPGYTINTTKLYLAVFQDPHHSATDGELEMRCVGSERPLRAQIHSYAVRVGDTMTVDIPESWTEKCHVIRLKWLRKLNRGGDSRERLMVIPKTDSSSESGELNLAFLHPINYSSQYTVGERVTVKASVQDDTYNYMVICNGKDLTRSARIDHSKTINFEATRKMLGNCVIYLYSTKTQQVDMLLFFVSDKCTGSTIPSRDTMKPGQKITITMNGQKNGYVIMRTLDEKIAKLMKKNGYVIMRTLDEKIAKLMKEDQPGLPKLWEGLFFARNFQKEEQIRMFNLVTLKSIKNIITKNCAIAGSLFNHKILGGTCPEGKASTSAVSDLCMRQITTNCQPGITPTQEAVCDRMGSSASCRYKEIEAEDSERFQPDLSEQFFSSTRPFGDGFTGMNGMNGMPGMPGMSSDFGGFAGPPGPFPSQDFSSFMRSFGRPTTFMDDFELEPPILPSDEMTFTRSYFPHVWIFDDYSLGPFGTSAIQEEAPHSVGRWVIQSDYWAPNEFSFCSAIPKYVTSTKSFFMEIDMPKNVYVNESVTVKISVTANDLEEEKQLSICYGNLPRQLCADMGPAGTHGLPAYSRIVLSKIHPITTKTFNMRFFKTGEVKIVFMLRTEVYVPGEENRCANGEVLDSIEQPIMIAKRAETEEHYRRLILSIEKPVSKSLNDAIEEVDRADVIRPNILDVYEYRAPHEDALISEIHTNIADTDSVYSITAEISKFLPSIYIPLRISNELRESEASRKKRGIVGYGNTFLSDVIKKLSVELYKFKLERTVLRRNDATTEFLENNIGALVADMLRFSDCSTNSSCGYYEYGRPINQNQRSPV